MNIWIVSAYDPIPGVDTDMRVLRYGSIAQALIARGHSVVLWTSSFAHWSKRFRHRDKNTLQVGESFTAELLHGPGYKRNVSWSRIRHNRVLAAAFSARAWRIS